ncbi:MAG: hypothetical protein QME83_15435 [Thermodesulfobacteriota bacterium]|nr:hypothetical protein [Thermodesulfobacteriota bacterium]
MRKVGIVVIFMSLFLISSLAFCQGLGGFRSEPSGFRGIEWGTDISKLKNNLKYVRSEEKDVRVYVRNKDELKIGKAQVKTIEYKFWTGFGKYGAEPEIFYAVYIETEGKENWKNLKEAAFDLFGKGTDLGNESYGWRGKKTSITMLYNPPTGMLLMDDIEIGDIRSSIKKQTEKEKTLKEKGF